MGEIDDLKLAGVLCSGCGVYLDGNHTCIPRYCCDECDPHYTPDNNSRKSESDKPFFVVKHAGSIKALPRFLAPIKFAKVFAGTDKRGNKMLRLKTTFNETVGIILLVSEYLNDQAATIIADHLTRGGHA